MKGFSFFLSPVACLWRQETTIFSVKSIMCLVKEFLSFGMGDTRKNKSVFSSVIQGLGSIRDEA